MPIITSHASRRSAEMPQNKAWTLASFPSGTLREDNFKLVEAPAPAPKDGEVLVKNLWLSLDPYMRGRLTQQKSYVKGVEIGEVMTGETAGEVVESRHPKFKPGDTVTAPSGWQLYCSVNGELLTKVDASRAPLSNYLGCLGMPGRTAYFGMKDIGAPKPGETVVVSAASGAVGMVVGQIAKIKGCRAVGIAGGREKCEYLVRELGFDAAIDYKSDDVKRTLRQHCPQGVDVYFDNVGGEILDTVLTQLARNARIVICGAISQYNSTTGVRGPANYMSLLVNRASMTGMLVFDYASRYPEAMREMAGWLAAGKLKTREDIVAGLETFPETLLKLFKGENFGKLVLKVSG